MLPPGWQAVVVGKQGSRWGWNILQWGLDLVSPTVATPMNAMWFQVHLLNVTQSQLKKHHATVGPQCQEPQLIFLLLSQKKNRCSEATSTSPPNQAGSWMLPSGYSLALHWGSPAPNPGWFSEKFSCLLGVVQPSPKQLGEGPTPEPPWSLQLCLIHQFHCHFKVIFKCCKGPILIGMAAWKTEVFLFPFQELKHMAGTAPKAHNSMHPIIAFKKKNKLLNVLCQMLSCHHIIPEGPVIEHIIHSWKVYCNPLFLKNSKVL